MLDSTVGTLDSPSGSTRPLSFESVGARLSATRRIASGSLLGGGKELVIEHAGQEYHLRLTRNDKLILTK